jgi:hypothetical protein
MSQVSWSGSISSMCRQLEQRRGELEQHGAAAKSEGMAALPMLASAATRGHTMAILQRLAHLHV